MNPALAAALSVLALLVAEPLLYTPFGALAAPASGLISPDRESLLGIALKHHPHEPGHHVDPALDEFMNLAQNQEEERLLKSLFAMWKERSMLHGGMKPEELGEPLPIAMQLQQEPEIVAGPQAQQLFGMHNAFMGDDTYDDKDKRGNYMSLCHFKICNMGRKRNLRAIGIPPLDPQ